MFNGSLMVLVFTFDKGDHCGSKAVHAVEVTEVALLAKVRASRETLTPYHVPDCTGSTPLASMLACCEHSCVPSIGLRVMCNGLIESKLDTSQPYYQISDVKA